MKLNCKPGDMAILVSSSTAPQHIGKIVKCTSLFDISGKAFWVIEQALENPSGIDYWAIADDRLKPIRPDEGDDETLNWAGKPEEVTA